PCPRGPRPRLPWYCQGHSRGPRRRDRRHPTRPRHPARATDLLAAQAPCPPRRHAPRPSLPALSCCHSIAGGDLRLQRICVSCRPDLTFPLRLHPERGISGGSPSLRTAPPQAVSPCPPLLISSMSTS